MRVVDLRSPAHRGWLNGADRAPNGSSPWWSRAAGRLVDAVQANRVRMRPASRPAPPLVVAVGNLALGGTGKTPVSVALAGQLADAGHRGCVLTRGYGSPLAGPLEVSPANAEAGDEARMMAEELTGRDCPVVQARRRDVGLAWLSSRWHDRDFVILEDGFQTSLGRHLDILIADTWSESPRGLAVRTGPVFPFGPWRETARGADRAHVVLVESPAPPVATCDGTPVTGFRRELVLPAGIADGERWTALSGVARPERFEEQAASVLGQKPLLAIRCDDHAGYGAGTVERVTAAIREAGSPLTLTTRKDWMKLKGRWPADLRLEVARQELTWTGTPTLPALVGERLAETGRS